MSLRIAYIPMLLIVALAWLPACGGGQTEPDCTKNGTCEPDACGPPRAPVMGIIHAGAELVFEARDGLPVEVGTAPDPEAQSPANWLAGPDLALPVVEQPTRIRTFARVDHESCADPGVFAFTYEVRAAYPPPAGQPGSLAVPADDPAIVGWATEVDRVTFGDEVDEEWQDTDQALGPAEGTSSDVVCLGRGGQITLGFSPPIADGPGADLAVFENSFSETFLDLGLVEVSSDGEHYLRFAHAYLGHEPVDAYGNLDTGMVGGLAGKYRQGFGTPFDLAVFAQAPEVLAGQVDLQAIRYVRIVDVIGDGSTLDSFGHPIYDPYPTTGSAGFDLDAVAVLNAGS